MKFPARTRRSILPFVPVKIFYFHFLFYSSFFFISHHLNISSSMLGNRFHDAGTPPPLNLPGLGRLGGDDTPSILSVANEEDEDNFYANPTIPPALVFPTKTTTTSEKKQDQATIKTTSQGRRPSHADQAIELVESVTGSNKYKKKRRRRTARPSVLASLLKLEGRFSTKAPLQQQQQQPQPSTSETSSSSTVRPPRPPFVKHHSARPLQQLRSIASSRALLQSLGRSTQSARNSGYFDDNDLDKAELGGYDLDSVAERMKITAEIADILERQDFIIKLGKNLVRTGAPTHRIVSNNAYTRMNSFQELTYCK
jgi:hypothetical protein